MSRLTATLSTVQAHKTSQHRLFHSTSDHASKKTSGVKDVQAESVKSGTEQRQDNDGNSMDAASPSRSPKARSIANDGNPEQVGFAEQVGGAASTADRLSSGEKQGKGPSKSEGRTAQGDEEAQPPGVFSSVKRALGFNTNSGDIKQNRGGGSGVTGTGTFGDANCKQQLHTSAFQSNYSRSVERDVPNPADYMRVISQELAKSRPFASRPRTHNLTRRFQRLSDEHGQDVIAMKRDEERKLERDAAVSIPKELPGGHPPKSVDHTSGEWSTAGFGDKQYRNVGVEEEPYEPPADDEEDRSKIDARQKKLRYGGLAKDPKLA